MTESTSPTQSSDTSPDLGFPIPEEVQSLLAEADYDAGIYGARAIPGAMQLVEIKTGAVVKQVEWSHAVDYARNVLRAATQGTYSLGETESLNNR